MKPLLVAAIVLMATSALAQTTRNNDDTCDIVVAPAATLLLPYFEVDFRSPRESALTTLFTVTNVSPQSQIARVTIWTDWAYPVLTFNLFLTGYDVQSVNLYDVIVHGQIARTSTSSPRGALSEQFGAGNLKFLPAAVANCSADAMPATIPRFVVDDLQTALSTGVHSTCGFSRIGGTHTNAMGYATIDVVADCTVTQPHEGDYYMRELLFDNVLIGDYQRVHPRSATGNHALGNSLVHIRAVPEGGSAGSQVGTNLPLTFYDRFLPAGRRGIDRRQPLPSTFAARYIQGGASGFLTYFHIWREAITGATAACSSYIDNRGLPVSETVRFDERENVTTTSPQVIITFTPGNHTTPATSSIPSTNTSFPPLTSGDVAGWMYLNLHDRGFGIPTAGRPRQVQNWVEVTMEAEGRYAAAWPAVPLGNGCSPIAPVPTDRTNNRIGPRP